MTVTDWFARGAYGVGNGQLDFVEFADGTTWTRGELNAQGLLLNGSESADTLDGVDTYGDIINGLGGDDTLTGFGGNDILDALATTL
ncbi:MAG: hypothetical protein GXP08_11685 [Gammaproteobacteria bacterium]|nr:hypothetical protein [Gammaproteobacteria bacterium]